MRPAGDYSHRVRVERRGVAGDDGAGNVLEAWAPLVTRWAWFRAQPGREALAAGRLESTTTGVLVLRRDATTATITAADRLVFVAGPWIGRIANILTAAPSIDGSEIEITLAEGVAT